MKEEGGAVTETKKYKPVELMSLEELKEYALRPPSEEELGALRAATREADRVRVKVGPDFNVAREIRKMRDAADGIDI